MKPNRLWIVVALGMGMANLSTGGTALATTNATAAPAKARVHRSASILDQTTHMDVNNLDMVVTNYGSLAYDLVTGNAGLWYPKGTNKTVAFAAGPWVGARVGGLPRVSAGYYGSEFVPGPMVNGTFVPDQPGFQCYRIDRGDTTSADYLNWPVSQGAPVDQEGRPLLLGDATIWSVYNDADFANHWVFGSAPLGIEIQQTTFAFNQPGPLSNTIFLVFKITNKGGQLLEDVHFSLWGDPDVGQYNDDLAGCDTSSAMGYAYNGTNADAVYGATPPAVGFSLLEGPRIPTGPNSSYTLGMTSFIKYVNGTDPMSAEEAYNYMQGLHADGSPIYTFEDPSYSPTTLMLYGDPVTGTGWVDTSPTDARLTVTTGPFPMPPGESYRIAFAIVVGQGTDRISSISDLRVRAQAAKQVYADLFPALPPPLSVDVDVQPNVVNLAGASPWLTAYLEPIGFDVHNIVPATVTLADVPADTKRAVIGDHDNDGQLDLMLKFSRTALRPHLFPGVNELRAHGLLVNGQEFSGADQVRVTLPAPPPPDSARVSPNPINPSGILTFTTSAPGHVTVRLFDIQGHLVRTLAEALRVSAGSHELRIDGRADDGSELASGVYFYRIETAAGALGGRVAILK